MSLIIAGSDTVIVAENNYTIQFSLLLIIMATMQARASNMSWFLQIHIQTVCFWKDYCRNVWEGRRRHQESLNVTWTRNLYIEFNTSYSLASPLNTFLHLFYSPDVNVFLLIYHQGKNIIVFYGSQTGTAEEFANRLSKDAQRYGMKGMAADPEEYDMVTYICGASDIIHVLNKMTSRETVCKDK